MDHAKGQLAALGLVSQVGSGKLFHSVSDYNGLLPCCSFCTIEPSPGADGLEKIQLLKWAKIPRIVYSLGKKALKVEKMKKYLTNLEFSFRARLGKSGNWFTASFP